MELDKRKCSWKYEAPWSLDALIDACMLVSCSSSLLSGDVHPRERQRQAQLRDVVVVGLGLGQLELRHIGLCRWADSATKLMEVLLDPVLLSAFEI